MFLDYGGDKRVRRKSYISANFYTDPDDSKSQSGYILKVGAISYSSSVQSIVDINICKMHAALNVTEPLTKLLSRAKHDHTFVLFGC